MKARVKSTGVLIDVIPKINTNALHSGDNLYVCDNMVFRECELDFLNIGNSAIDWEQRRYEIAKSAMQGILCAPIVEGIDPNPTPWELARMAVRNADALIKELKKGE
ncbi:hypothetical protein ACIXPA_18240 [Bacteroides fragilis]|jgi:hypothetical protein